MAAMRSSSITKDISTPLWKLNFLQFEASYQRDFETNFKWPSIYIMACLIDNGTYLNMHVWVKMRTISSFFLQWKVFLPLMSVQQNSESCFNREITIENNQFHSFAIRKRYKWAKNVFLLMEGYLKFRLKSL